MTITLNALQKQRRDTASNWTSNNPTLLDGELGYETDTKKFKIGDGSTAWQSLDYLPIPDTNRLLTGNLTVGGNFTVNGTQTVIDSQTLQVEDKNIEIGKVSTPSDTTADGGGITLKAASDKTITWSNANDSWDFNQNINAASTYAYKINNVSVLNATTLGSSVVNSSLTSVGTIATGVWNATAIARSKLANVDLVDDTSPQLGGDLDLNSNDITGTGNINITGELTIGGSDLNMIGSSDGNRYFDARVGTDSLQIRATTGGDSGHTTMAKFFGGGAVELYHAGTKKFETSANGLTISGNPTINGNTNANGHITLPDHTGSQDGKLRLGTGHDLQIYHDGSHSYLKDSGTGAIKIIGNDIRIENDSNRNIFKAVGTACELYFDTGSATSKRFETTSTGVIITGNDASGSENYGSISYKAANGTVRGFFNTTNDRFEFKDNFYSSYGNNQDLSIYHNGTDNFITAANGHLNIYGDGSNEIHIKGIYTKESIKVIPNGGVELYHNNAKRFETTSTGAKISGTGATFFEINSTDGSVNPMVRMTNGDRTWDAGLRGDTSDSYVIRDHTASANRLTIDSSGNIGIGTTNPTSPDGSNADNPLNGPVLTVYGDSPAINLTSSTTGSDDYSLINFGRTGSSSNPYRAVIGYKQSDDILRINANNHIAFDAGGGINTSERMRIDGSGRVLINRTSAFSTGSSGTESAKLQVGISGTSGTAVGFADTGGYDTNVMVMNHARAGANSNSFTGVMIQFRNKDNTTVGSITCDIGATNYYTSSDYRLKENVTAISDGITRLKTLKPCRFNWKVDKNHTIDGFLAHEVTAVPESINGVKDGMKAETYYEEGDELPSGKVVGDVKTYSSTKPEYQSIDQSKLVPLLVAAVQELIGKVEALEAA